MGGISLLDFIFISRAQRFYIIIAAYQFNHYIWPVLTKLQEDARLGWKAISINIDQAATVWLKLSNFKKKRFAI